MDRTYHDYLEALYAGRAYVFAEAGGMFRVAAYRDHPAPFDWFSTFSSFHFGDLFDYGGLTHFDDPADAPWADAEALMHEQGRDVAAFVLNFDHGHATIMVSMDVVTAPGHIVINAAIFQERQRIPNVPVGEWVKFEGDATGMFGPQFVTLAHSCLTLLGSQSIQYVMREPSNGMARLTAARAKRGERPPPDMKTVRLTKTVYVGVNAIHPVKGTHASPEPHDRKGHWRHSEREIPGWEEVQPTTGEYAGMTVWRKWIKDTPINGGKPKGAAPQFRVVK